MLLQSATKTQLLLGQCVPCIKQGASKFKIKRLELDTNINMVCKWPKGSFMHTFLFRNFCPCDSPGKKNLHERFINLLSLLKRQKLQKRNFFPKHEVVYAHDPEKKCKTGDLVIIELLPERLTRLITHKVKEVLYPMGDIIDPITGKKVVVGKFRGHIDKINKIYGEKDTRFKYDQAPERGWQEDKKDFTHVETYIKYHEDGTHDPKAV